MTPKPNSLKTIYFCSSNARNRFIPTDSTKNCIGTFYFSYIIDLNFPKEKNTQTNRYNKSFYRGKTLRGMVFYEDVRFCFFQRRIKQNEDVKGDKRGNIIPQCGRYIKNTHTPTHIYIYINKFH